MDCIVHGVAKSRTQLSDFHFRRRSYWIRWPLTPVTVVLIRRERFGDTQTHPKGRRPCDNKGRDWSDAAMNQGKLRIASNQQKLDKKSAFKESMALPTL